ncbi:MAG TPA: hypothetical protein VHZ03_24105 [Trebonia sp.]|jgi:hypothetical protein|nr:hypothetical protein [Trebonia sp.]
MTEIAAASTVPLAHVRLSPTDAAQAASEFADRMPARRSVREFSSDPRRRQAPHR